MDILRELEKAPDQPDATGIGLALVIRLSLRKQIMNQLVPPFGTLHLVFGIAASLVIAASGILLCLLGDTASGKGSGVMMIILGVASLALTVIVAVGTAGVQNKADKYMDALDGQSGGGSKPGKGRFNLVERIAVDGSVRSVLRSLELLPVDGKGGGNAQFAGDTNVGAPPGGDTNDGTASGEVPAATEKLTPQPVQGGDRPGAAE